MCSRWPPVIVDGLASAAGRAGLVPLVDGLAPAGGCGGGGRVGADWPWRWRLRPGLGVAASALGVVAGGHRWGWPLGVASSVLAVEAVAAPQAGRGGGGLDAPFAGRGGGGAGRGAPTSRWRRWIQASRRRWRIPAQASGVRRRGAGRRRQCSRREASERRERQVGERDGFGGTEAAGLRPLCVTRTRGSLLGRVQPCRVGKLESSFSLGQGRGAFSGRAGHCPFPRTGLTNTKICKYLS
jgi:hypothetical protein